MLQMHDRGLSEEQRMMRDACRAFVDGHVTPFIRQNWQREWSMDPDGRLPPSILEEADRIGIRTLGVPEEFGGVELDPATEVQTFALIAEEIARGDSGLADKLVQNWKVSVLLRNVAPRHLQEKWSPRLVKDPAFLLAHCLTEPRGASDRCGETQTIYGWVVEGDDGDAAVHRVKLALMTDSLCKWNGCSILGVWAAGGGHPVSAATSGADRAAAFWPGLSLSGPGHCAVPRQVIWLELE